MAKTFQVKCCESNDYEKTVDIVADNPYLAGIHYREHHLDHHRNLTLYESFQWGADEVSLEGAWFLWIDEDPSGLITQHDVIVQAYREENGL